MWRLPWNKRPCVSLPIPLPQSLHMLTEQLASGQLHPWPSVGGLVVTSVITNKIKTPYHLHNLHKHLHTCMKASPVLFFFFFFQHSHVLLARSAIITHSEWLWKVYSFLKSDKNNRVTITVSDVAVSFHCVSSSSGLLFPPPRWHSCWKYSSVRGQNWKKKIRFYPDVINMKEPAEAKSRMSASAWSNQKYPIWGRSSLRIQPVLTHALEYLTKVGRRLGGRFSPLSARETRSNGHRRLRSSAEQCSRYNELLCPRQI